MMSNLTGSGAYHWMMVIRCGGGRRTRPAGEEFMGRSRSRALVGATLLLGIFAGASAPRAGAEAPAEPPRPHKSVYGKLAGVDKSRSGIVMKSDSGERLSWRFDAAVIAEAARFKPGDPMIVIYRQTAPNQKRVTALAFPGSATTPLYVNTTGSRVVVRSSAAVNGECGGPGAGPVSESTIPSGGVAEVLEACWCCAVAGESCAPGNKSGLGRALLVQCFQ